ncbi:MAG: CapA family protein [bacterium]
MEKENKTITIAFAGDTMLGRLVNQVIGIKDYKYPWGTMLPILHEQDLNIINLETTLTKSKKQVPKVFNFKADPDKVQTLIEGRIDVVSLANNHSLDFSEEGLLETMQVLEKANILYVGAGKNITEARKPIIVTKHGISCGIIGWTDNEPEWLATETQPGTNYIAVGDLTSLKHSIDQVRSKVDYVIVTAHWGPNKRQRPPKEFIDFAHQMIDAGVDIFQGHSAHIFQGIEIYKHKIIMYDTGDFVDDYAVYPDLRNDHSFLFRITLDKKHVKTIELVPVLISEMQVNKAPSDQAQEMLEKMKKLSAEFGTAMVIKNERGFISVH